MIWSPHAFSYCFSELCQIYGCWSRLTEAKIHCGKVTNCGMVVQKMSQKRVNNINVDGWWCYPLVNFLVLLCTLQCQCWNIFCCLQCNEYHIVYNAIIFFFILIHMDAKQGRCICCFIVFFSFISIFLYSEWIFCSKKRPMDWPYTTGLLWTFGSCGLFP